MASKALSFRGFPREPSGTKVVRNATTLDYALHLQSVRCDIYSAVKREKTGITSTDDLEKGQRRIGSLRMFGACSYSKLCTRSGNFIDKWNTGTADRGKVFTRNEG